MSLVGPRPLPAAYTPFYTAREATRLLVRPGLCGLAQAQGRNAVPWQERLEWDARYVERISFAGDLRIILRCALVLLRGEGVHAAGEATMAPLTASRRHSSSWAP
jgi:lipopolysaccharide/colanic/teichoic acid biosynthesis glycosyltransferase